MYWFYWSVCWSPTPFGNYFSFNDFILSIKIKNNLDNKELLQAKYEWCYPIESWRGNMGMTPARLVSPTVGLNPTTELWSAGQRMEPWVSLPMDTATMFAATEMADPLLEPHGSPDCTYGFCTLSIFKSDYFNYWFSRYPWLPKSHASNEPWN
jgi:hypothetical protein